MEIKRNLALATLLLLVPLIEAHLQTLDGLSELNLEACNAEEAELVVRRGSQTVAVEFGQKEFPEIRVAHYVDAEPVAHYDRDPKRIAFSDHPWCETPEAMALAVMPAILKYLALEA